MLRLWKKSPVKMSSVLMPLERFFPWFPRRIAARIAAHREALVSATSPLFQQSNNFMHPTRRSLAPSVGSASSYTETWKELVERFQPLVEITPLSLVCTFILQE